MWPDTREQARGGRTRCDRIGMTYFMRASGEWAVENAGAFPRRLVAPGRSWGRRTGGRTTWKWKAGGSSRLLPPRVVVLVRVVNRPVVPGTGSKGARERRAVGGPESQNRSEEHT